ncbi:outer membrane beta-barrel protein [Vibrio anguillarum]|uniref:outer membrane beta-barrel protein n=1 Tax=Vibrio anguillarum TaxID=55601 RepID=UPI002E19B5A3
MAPFASAAPYIGLEFGAGGTNATGLHADEKAAQDELEKVGQFKLYGVKYIKDNLRSYFFYQGVASPEVKQNGLDLQNESTQFGLGLDYLHYFSGKFYGLAGVSVGYHNSEFTLSIPSDSFSMNAKDSGMMYEASLGLGYRFGNHFSMEGGYRYGFYEQKFALAEEGTITLKNPSLIYLGFGYKF